MANIAQSVQHAQEGLPLAEAMQQQNVVQQNLEEVTRVSRPADEGAESQVVKNESRGASQNGSHGNRKKRDGDAPIEKQTHAETVHESFIGQHVDITR